MFTMVTILGKAAKSLFFGTLRDIEIEVGRKWPFRLVVTLLTRFRGTTAHVR